MGPSTAAAVGTIQASEAKASEIYIDEFLHVQSMRGRSTKTLRAYRFHLTAFARFIGKDLSTVITPDVRRYLMVRESKGRKKTTIATEIAVLRSFYGWMAREDYVAKDPMVKIDRPKLDKSLPKFLTAEEMELLWAACKNDRERALIELFYSSGMRLSELQQLNRDDVDFADRTIKVLGKGSKERYVQFSTRAAIYLKHYLDSRTDSDPALFLSRYKRRWSAASIERAVREVAKRAGVHRADKRVYPHRLRHTFATRLVDAGVPLEVVQQELGHASPSTTQIYAQVKMQARKEHYRKVFV